MVQEIAVGGDFVFAVPAEMRFVSVGGDKKKKGKTKLRMASLGTVVVQNFPARTW